MSTEFRNNETPLPGHANATTPMASDNASRGVAERLNSVHLSPHGLAAIPLLCAAASESREAYLSRMRTSESSHGWWARQEPLSAKPGSNYAIPEAIVLKLASIIEDISLRVGDGRSSLPFPPSTIQAYLWPVHNVVICLWIMLIILHASIESVVLCIRTVLFGKKVTGMTFDRILSEEIIPCTKATATLWEPNQSLPVRVLGLFLTPLVLLHKGIFAIKGHVGEVACNTFYILGALVMWWYWLSILLWTTGLMLVGAFGAGWCYALIELARVWAPKKK